MALGKTITYTPFQETSFGYGSGQLATNYATEFPNATDIVKIVIEHSSGNWDETGHISTPSSGTAISIYNKNTDTLIIKGERDDVDVVLSNLKFFPADYSPSRTWKPLAFKENQTSGSYASENPPAIGDTLFAIRAYDSNDTEQASETITFDPTEPNYGNARPYFSTAPAQTNYSSTVYDTDGDVLDFGTIFHDSATENINVSLYFRQYRYSHLGTIYTDGDLEGELNTTNFEFGNSFGSFITDNIYIDDKKPSDPIDKAKLDFTGSVAECNAFLENVKYKTNSSSSETTFEIIATVSDGSVGSTIVKSMWHDKTLQVSTLPNQTFKEDFTAKFDLGNVLFSNKDTMPEVNNYKAVITLDSTGTGGATSLGTTISVDTETYSSGVLTIEDTNFATFKNAIRNLEFVPDQDFADNFTFTVQFTFENTSFGSSYSSTQQTVNVTAQEQAEVEFINVTHSWNEDQVYYFNTHTPLQIVHPYNESFSVEFDYQLGDITDIFAAGELQTTSTETHTRTITGNIITFTGTRDALNDVLENLYFAPATDYNTSFTINVTVERTSGSNLANADVSTGVWTMSATAQEEYSHTQPAKYNWDEDKSLDFATGINILDTSLDDPLLPAFGAKFKITLRAKYIDGTSVNANDITWTCFNTTNVTISGSGTVADPMIIAGDRADINVAMNALRMTPKADFTATQDFRFEYKLERGVSTDDFYALYANYNKYVEFDKGTPSDDFSTPSEYKFGIERITSLSEYRIVDVAENKQYQVKFTIDSDGEGFLRAFEHNNVIVTWDESTSTLEITGNKNDINYTLLSLEYIPTFNFNTDFKIYYYQKQTTDNSIQADGTDYFDMKFDSTLLKYQLDTINQNIFYSEDLLEQSNILAYTKLKNLDGASEITDKNVYYVTTVRLNPTDQIYFSYDYAESETFETGALLDVVETRASELTFTGSRDYCNQKIKELVFSGFPDQVGDVDLIYTQERWVDGKFDEITANEVTALTLRGVDEVGEANFSEYSQYFTTEGSETITGEIATPRYLQEYRKENGLPKNFYSPPINIIDKASEPGGETLYKIEVISSSLENGMSIEDTDFKTKEQFAEQIKDGIRLIASETLIDTLQHEQEFKIYFRVIRKLPSGTTSTIEENFLNYRYISRPRSFVWKTDVSENYQEVEYKDNLTFTVENAVEMQDGSAKFSDSILLGVEDTTQWSWGYKQNRSQIKGGVLYENSHPVQDMFFDEYQKSVSRSYIGDVKNIPGDEVFEIEHGNVGQDMRYYGRTYYKKFNVKAFGQFTVGTFKHEVETSWGLKASLNVNYKEQIIKYSEHMSHTQIANDYITPCFGHDTAGLNGSWSVTPLQHELVSDPINRFTATLCSHFWVADHKYAFGFIDSNDDTKNNQYPFDGDKNTDLIRGIRGFPIDKRYISTPKWDKRMRTPNNHIMSNFDFNRLNAYGFAAKILYTGWENGAKYKNELPNQVIVDEYIQVKASGQTKLPNTVLKDNSLDRKDYINPTIAARYFDDPERFGASGYTMMTTFGRGAFYDFEAVINGQSYLYNFYNNEWRIEVGSPNFPDMADGSPAPWFDSISVDINDISRQNVRFDLQVSNNITINDGKVYPRSVFLVRSYFHNNKTINECAECHLELGNGFSGLRYPRNYVKSVKDGTSEYNMWARRNPKDNTSRILPVDITQNFGDLGDYTNTAYILPTGEYIHPDHGLTDFATHPLLNINTDLRGKSIDKFIKIDQNRLAYVSVQEGKIDDGNNLIDIRFDNKLSSSDNYNYIYVTQDPYNRKKLYAMMAYLNTGNTYTSNANTLRSRLIYFNLEE